MSAINGVKNGPIEEVTAETHEAQQSNDDKVGGKYTFTSKLLPLSELTKNIMDTVENSMQNGFPHLEAFAEQEGYPSLETFLKKEVSGESPVSKMIGIESDMQKESSAANEKQVQNPKY